MKVIRRPKSPWISRTKAEAERVADVKQLIDFHRKQIAMTRDNEVISLRALVIEQRKEIQRLKAYIATAGNIVGLNKMTPL